MGDHDDTDRAEKRISPLRGLGPEDIVSQTKVVRNGLSALRDDHYNILKKIRDDESHVGRGEEEEDGNKENGKRRGGLLEERVENVTRSLERLEVGIEESSVLLRLDDHFRRLEADRSTLRLEMGRVQDENEWLREELAQAQERLLEASLEVTELREEKRRWEFEEELRREERERVARPVTPSRIPVGSWRVEEERDINRALNGERSPSSAGSSSRNPSPAPSRIPTLGSWRSKAGTAYSSLMKKEEETQRKKKAAAAAARGPKGRGGGPGGGGGQYFKLNAAGAGRGGSKIPAR